LGLIGRTEDVPLDEVSIFNFLSSLTSDGNSTMEDKSENKESKGEQEGKLGGIQDGIDIMFTVYEDLRQIARYVVPCNIVHVQCPTQ